MTTTKQKELIWFMCYQLDRSFICRGCGEKKVMTVDELIKHHHEVEESDGPTTYAEALNVVGFCLECVS